MREEQPGQSDADLILASQRGDAAALGVLLARHEAQVYRFAVTMCRNPEDARETLQETLLAAAKGIGNIRGDTSMSTWLYTIARGICIKQRRRRATAMSRGEFDDDVVSEAPNLGTLPDGVAMSHEVRIALDRAIGSLPRAYREVLVLRDVEGLTAPEVAAALGVGADIVKSRLHRARISVREKLGSVAGAVFARAEGCPDVLGISSQRLEGEADARLCEEMDRHIARCPRCAATSEGLTRSLALCRAVREAPVPAGVQGSVRRAVRELLRLP
jgi:RNA polymerase sigma-70 factor (ECF subfamily)